MIIKMYLQKIYVQSQQKELWQYSSKERKAVAIFGQAMQGVSISKYTPGVTQNTSPDIYSCFVPQYTDEIAQEVIDANGSNVFYYATDDAGNEAIITEEEGLAKMKESMQASTAQPSV